MKKWLGIPILLFVLSACGSGGGGDTPGNSAQSSNYVTLAFSGSGTSITGTQFTVSNKSFSSDPYSGSLYTWTSNDGTQIQVSVVSQGQNYPGNYIRSVTVTHGSHTWASNPYINEPGIIVGSSTVVFGNVNILETGNTFTTLTLNGTLSF